MAGDDIVRYIQEADFEREVLQNAGPVVVAFWAPWSDPSVLFAPVITRAARAHANQVKTLAINVEETRTLRGRYGIVAVPTLLYFFEGGKVKGQIVGTTSIDDVEHLFSGKGSPPGMTPIAGAARGGSPG
ncbi:MAG TPA: thioredoxin domain-containing protein [Myxococcaceae bacterium]|jgi:thioredoxin 1